MLQMRPKRTTATTDAARAAAPGAAAGRGRHIRVRPVGSHLPEGWVREVITAVDNGHDRLMLASDLTEDEWEPAWEVQLNEAAVAGIVRAPYGVAAAAEERLRETGWQPALVDCPPGAPAHHQWFVLTAEAARMERSRRQHPSAEAAAVGSPAAGGLGL